MELEFARPPAGASREEWARFLDETGIGTDDDVDFTVIVRDRGKIAATGSMTENILKCIAVADEYREEGLMGTVMTELRREAFSRGYEHLFLYTKPANRLQFEGMLFYEVAATRDVLLMENEKDGVRRFVAACEKPVTYGNIGSVVMNADPFTTGHGFLVARAAQECEHVYLFVLSEDKGFFAAEDRLEMVKLGTAEFKNVTVLETGPYLISSASFPTYFIKEAEAPREIKCGLDIEIFGRLFAPAFGIRKRFIGTEPLSQVTAAYNRQLARKLPEAGIEVREIERLSDGSGPISAGRVRECVKSKKIGELKKLVPATTFRYLEEKDVL